MTDTAERNTPQGWFRPPLLDAFYLTGPTASGKSDIALALANRLDAEIVSLDSMAVYRGMDIGTAKPTAAQQQQVRHHLIDVVDPTDEYSVSQFVAAAHESVADIRRRGRQALVVGGSPLYLKALLRGLFLGPPADWDFRQAVAADVETYGIESLRQRVFQVDPVTAHRLLPNDLRRMTRALEVARASGRPLSHWQTQFEQESPALRGRVANLSWDRGQLHARVASRVHQMFSHGLVEEVQQLLDHYQPLGRTALQAVGYKEPIDYLAGRRSLDETQELVTIHTRQFVRRQEMWFRSLPELRSIPMATDRPSRQVEDEVLAVWGA